MAGRQFKTTVPKERAIPIELIKKHPYDEEDCKDCFLAKVCKNASQNLPFKVKSISEPRIEHNCSILNQPLQICWVYHITLPKSNDANNGQSAGLYLLDANVFIYADNSHPRYGRVCNWILNDANIDMVTTLQIADEVSGVMDYKPPSSLTVVRIGKIDREIKSLKPTYGKKRPSIADMSLMQAVIDNGDVKGIITMDNDFINIAAAGILSNMTGRHIEVLTPFELRKKISK